MSLVVHWSGSGPGKAQGSEKRRKRCTEAGCVKSLPTHSWTVLAAGMLWTRHMLGNHKYCVSRRSSDKQPQTRELRGEGCTSDDQNGGLVRLASQKSAHLLSPEICAKL